MITLGEKNGRQKTILSKYKHYLFYKLLLYAPSSKDELKFVLLKNDFRIFYLILFS